MLRKIKECSEFFKTSVLALAGLAVSFAFAQKISAEQGVSGEFKTDIVKERRFDKIPWAQYAFVKKTPEMSAVGALASARTPQGGYLLAAGFYGAVQIWDLNALKPVETLRTPELDGAISDLKYSADAERIYAAVSDAGVSGALVEIFKGKTKTLLKFKDSLYCIAVSPDGKFLAGGAFDSTRFVYDLRGGKLAGKYSLPRGVRPLSLAFSSDGTRLIAGYSNGFIEEYSAADAFKKPVRKFDSPAPVSAVGFVCSDGGFCAAAYDEAMDILFAESFAEGNRRLMRLGKKKIQSAVFEPVYQRVAAAASDGTFMYISMQSLNRLILEELDIDLPYDDDSNKVSVFTAKPKSRILSLCAVSQNAFAAGLEDGRICIFARTLNYVPSAVIFNLSHDGKKWCAFTKEGYSSASSPELISWKMYSQLPPDEFRVGLFYNSEMLEFFMREHLTGAVAPLPPSQADTIEKIKAADEARWRAAAEKVRAERAAKEKLQADKRRAAAEQKRKAAEARNAKKPHAKSAAKKDSKTSAAKKSGSAKSVGTERAAAAKNSEETKK